MSKTKSTSSRLGKRVGILAILLILAIGGGYAYYTYGYQPARQTANTAEMLSASARRGDLVIYASGSGKLVSASEASFGFGASGQVTQINVRVGDEVNAGDILAELNNASVLLSYEQAKRNLAQLTSPAAIASARQNLSLAEEELTAAAASLKYLISPSVLTWEERLIEAQAGLRSAQEAAQASPSDENSQKVRDAELAVKLAEANLRTAQEDYAGYVEAMFTETTTDPRTGEERIKYYYDENGNKYTVIYAPTQAQIETARAAYELAKATLTEAKYYYAALNGEEIPAEATGSALAELQKAMDTLRSAEEDLKNTQLIAPISGTIMSLDFSVGDVVGTSSVVTIADLSRQYLEVFLDESDWANVNVGYPVEVTFDILPEKVFNGEVVQVDPGLYTSGNTSVVRTLVRLDTGASFKLPLGTSASVDVIGGRAENAILVPLEALRETSPGEYAVFVVEDGKPRLRVIEVGIMDLLYAEVRSGLEAGEIVTTGIAETQ